MSWQSPQNLALSSNDGICTFLTLENKNLINEVMEMENVPNNLQNFYKDI